MNNLDFLLKQETKDHDAYTHGLFFDFQSRRVLRDYPTDKRDEKIDRAIIDHLIVAGLIDKDGITALGHHVREADKKFGPGPIPMHVAFGPWPVADLTPQYVSPWAYMMLWGIANGRDGSTNVRSWIAFHDYLHARLLKDDEAGFTLSALLPATPDPAPPEKPKKTRKKAAEPELPLPEPDDFSILDDEPEPPVVHDEYLEGIMARRGPAPDDDDFDDFI